MSQMQLTRQQRRALKMQAPDIEQACEGDRRFFERHRSRNFRIRRASRGELAQREVISGVSAALIEPDTAIFTAVRQLAPGVRLRVWMPGPVESIGDELSEAACAELWRSWADRHPFVREREAAMLKAMRLPGGPLHGGGAS